MLSSPLGHKSMGRQEPHSGRVFLLQLKLCGNACMDTPRVFARGDSKPIQVDRGAEPLQFVVQVQGGAGLLTLLRGRACIFFPCLSFSCPPVPHGNSVNWAPPEVLLLQASIDSPDGKLMQMTCVYLKSVNKRNCLK